MKTHTYHPRENGRKMVVWTQINGCTFDVTKKASQIKTHLCGHSVKLSHCHGNHFSKSCFDNFDINLPKIHFYFKFYNFTICVYDIGC